MIRFEVEEQEECRYLVYHKQDTDTVSRLVMGMIKNNTIEGTVPFMQSQMNAEIQYRYEITGKQSLAEYFGNVVSKKMLLQVLENILGCKAALEEYMLDMDAVVLDSQYIFVEPGTGKVQMIVLPVEHENVSMEQFFRMLIFSAQYDPSEDGSYIARLLSYFNSGETFSTVSFAKMIQELKNGKKQPMYTQAPSQMTPSKLSEMVEDPYGETIPMSALMQEADHGQPDHVGTKPKDTVRSAVEDEGTTVLSRNSYEKVQTYVNPNLQQKAAQPGNYYQGQQPVAAPSGSGQKFTNPNLIKAPGQIQIPQMPGNAPKTYPGTPKATDPQPMEMPIMPPQLDDEANEKVKKGLFGKKDKKEKTEKKGLFGKKDKEKADGQGKKVQLEKKPLSFKGIAIPGSDVVQPQANAASNESQAAVPSQNVHIPVYNAPIQNFGETVDLKSYTQETSVLDGGQNIGMISPCLIRKTTKEQFFLSKEVTRIGRSRDNVDIYITDNTSIGRVHAVLYWENSHVFIEDQHSRNGTFVNDRKILGREELSDGSRIRLSNEEFEFRLL